MNGRRPEAGRGSSRRDDRRADPRRGRNGDRDKGRSSSKWRTLQPVRVRSKVATCRPHVSASSLAVRQVLQTHGRVRSAPHHALWLALVVSMHQAVDGMSFCGRAKVPANGAHARAPAPGHGSVIRMGMLVSGPSSAAAKAKGRWSSWSMGPGAGVGLSSSAARTPRRPHSFKSRYRSSGRRPVRRPPKLLNCPAMYLRSCPHE